jgi:hypothetical protein
LARESKPTNKNLTAVAHVQAGTATLADPYLFYKASIVDDLERIRLANENRLRIMVRSEADSDGEERGWGLDPSHAEVVSLQGMVESLKALEKEAVTLLQKAMRRHPLWVRWGQGARGIGEKQLGRLLAQVGDPYINVATGLPRRVSSLWAYSGLHVVFVDQDRADSLRSGVDEDLLTPVVGHTDAELHEMGASSGGSIPEQGGDADQGSTETHSRAVGVAPRRRRGIKSNWSTHAKVRAYLIAESTVKQRDRQCEDGHVEGCTCSKYRLVYERRRAHTAVTHGPDTKAPWTKGHSQNDALRITSKAILKDLWRAARDWHVSQLSF